MTTQKKINKKAAKALSLVDGWFLRLGPNAVRLDKGISISYSKKRYWPDLKKIMAATLSLNADFSNYISSSKMDPMDTAAMWVPIPRAKAKRLHKLLGKYLADK